MKTSTKNSKIFGIGLSRTGTSSLTEALRILGFNVVHYPTDETTYLQLSTGHYALSLLDQYDGVTDIVVAPFFAQLDRIYPGSKFILTIRDVESWLQSIERHWHNRAALDSNVRDENRVRVVKFYRAVTYGTYAFSRQRMQYVFDTHYKNVVEYFRGRSNDLLIMNLVAGETWERLAPFLGCSTPLLAFPRVNTQSTM